MASFMEDSLVKFACSCGILRPLSKLFFCRHCPGLRCGFCVCHEVDSHFCSNCLENIPSSEVRHKKNCCANCFDCPSCQHSLTARATTVIVSKKPEENKDNANESAKSESSNVLSKKMYYLSCLSCRWTSRDGGIPDQSVAVGAWPENECSFQSRFNSLLEYYQAVVQQDKQEKLEYMKRVMPKVHKYPSLTDRTGLRVPIIRRQMGWSDKNTQKAKPVYITPSEQSDNINDLPDSIFREKVNLCNVTTVKQRHNQPGEQPLTVDKLYPQRRCMWIKRSLRCRQCEHNVIKPEYHPTSIKYRIQLFASYHVPDVRMEKCEKPLQAGQRNSVILKFINPTIHDTIVKLVYLPTQADASKLIEEFKLLHMAKEDSLTSINKDDAMKSLNVGLDTGVKRQSSMLEVARPVKQLVNCEFEPLDSEFILNLRDDSKDFDEDLQSHKKTPPFIIWSRSNKVKIRLNFTTNEDLKHGDDVYLGFNLLYTYVNTVSNTPERKEPTLSVLNCRVFIKVGCIQM